MIKTSDTARRILTAFLKLIAERGMEATTMRVLAEEAGVNEVTIFRLFTDKETLVREVYEHFGPASRIAAYPIAFERSTPMQAGAGLVQCLIFLRSCLREYPQLAFTGASEAWRFPGLAEEFAAPHHSAADLIKRALAHATPWLRPELDLDTVAFSLLGLVLTMLFWQHRGWLLLTEQEWERRFIAAVAPLVRGE